MVLAVEDGSFEPVLFDQLLQQLLAGKLGVFADVNAVQPQEIEGEENEAVLVASAEVCLKFGEVGALFVDDYHLTIDNGLPLDVEGARNDREPVDPVMAVAGEGLPVVAVDVELDAVAVVFDFVNPLSARRSF